MTRANWIISIFFAGLLAALIVLGLLTMSDALLGMVFVLPTIRIKYCTECKWYTNHCQLKSGEWICSCATIHTPEIAVREEGTDNTLLGSLQDAGFGSYGPL